ncbi:MAG TPA: alpha/beta fold hydrolase [Solirubrobacteraceae bacterium]|nr:alpha/beta fold hydrolase [Solirubrobacteraceae bacterium]
MPARCLVLAVLAFAALAAPAQAQIEFCGPSSRQCGRLTVPLDHAGQVAGTVKLAVERRRAKKPKAPPLFLLAGGPGQSATRAFSSDVVLAVLDGLVRRQDIVVFDQRGTGDSGSLVCRALQRATTTEVGAAAEQCAAALGPSRVFYRTADSVADIEAVRAALGAPRISLLGVSYGTKVALDYAAAFPARVDRMVLDSVVGPAGIDPLYRSTFAAAPRVLRELCRRRCGRTTPGAVRDLERLVPRLPLRGFVVTPQGRRVPAELTRFDLLSTLLAGDLRQLVRARFPAAVRSAVLGDTAPILRLAAFASEGTNVGANTLSAATFATTVCGESPLPWAPAAPPDQRMAQARATVAALPAGAFAPFDAETALESDVLALCERWPDARAATTGARPLPDVPVLLLSGSQDLRTPTEDARRVAALFPRARALTVRRVGHSVLATDLSGCAVAATGRFLAGRRVMRTCAAPGAQLAPTPRDPASLQAVRPAGGAGGRPGRTFAAVRLAYQDALRAFFDGLLAAGASDLDAFLSFRYAAGGLRAGRSVFTFSNARFSRLVYVPGVTISGRLRSLAILPDGALRVSGPAAARGTLRVRNGRASGVLGGRRVRGTLGPDLFDLAFGLLE